MLEQPLIHVGTAAGRAACRVKRRLATPRNNFLQFPA
jgi:hypothetical protein